MLLYVFDQAFQLCGITSGFKTLKWSRKFADTGSFELVLPFDREQFALYQTGRIIYKKDVDEAAFILDLNISIDAEGKEQLTVRGKMLSEMLAWRIADYTASAVYPHEALRQIVTTNMITSANVNRNIPGLAVDEPQAAGLEKVNVKAEHETIAVIAKDLCFGINLGYRVRFDHEQKKYRVQIYQGAEQTGVVFSPQLRNAAEQEYFEESMEWRNTAAVDKNGAVTYAGDENAGLGRREVYLSINDGDAAAQGRAHLAQYPYRISLDSVIDGTSKQFVYLRDWNLGDIVTCKNSRWGVSIQKNISEIEEVYDEKGKHLAVTFGDIVPTMKGR